MKRLKPSAENFRAWAKIPPVDGDLVFCRTLATGSALARGGFLVYSAADFKDQAADLWSLNRRAWHGYALSRSKAVGYLPAGALEKLSVGLRARLLRDQLTTNNSAVLSAEGKDPRWITAAYWKNASGPRRQFLLREWYSTREAHGGYAQRDPAALPAEVRGALRAAGILSLVNTYVNRSGPNCFALAASFADGERLGVHERWLHPGPFFAHLKMRGYRERAQNAGRDAGQDAGIVVIGAGKDPVHAAISLGHGWLLEKPGQSFFEPYRLLTAEEFRAEWPRGRVRFFSV